MSATLEVALAGARGGFRLDLAFSAPLIGTTALFGPSGCGKTTSLRALAGLIRLEGRVAVGETLWQDDAAGVFVPAHRRALGYVFQEPALFAHLSVAGNLRYGHKRAARGAKVQDGAFRFEEIVELLGLGALLPRAPAGLSGGEKQRVALGRALLSQPRLLLMDEPLSALDRASRDMILDIIATLPTRLRVPILYVSHDLAEVARLAARVVLLDDGRKRAEGPVDAVLQRLDLGRATGRFEAGSVLRARLIGHDHAFKLSHLDHCGQTLSVPLLDVPPGQEVRLRVRARDVALALQRPQAISVRNVLQGRIERIAEEPDTAFAETRIALDGGQRLRARLTRAAVADLGLAPGSTVFALIKSVAIERGAISAMPPDGLAEPEA